jgi:hypothetical protein
MEVEAATTNANGEYAFGLIDDAKEAAREAQGEGYGGSQNFEQDLDDSLESEEEDGELRVDWTAADLLGLP